MSFTNDKFLHFTISFLLVPFFFYIIPNILIAFGLAMLVGLAKETYDHFSPHHVFDIKDIYANLAGGTLSFIFMFIVDVIK